MTGQRAKRSRLLLRISVYSAHGARYAKRRAWEELGRERQRSNMPILWKAGTSRSGCFTESSTTDVNPGLQGRN